MKLLLLGKTRNESVGDPMPVWLPGEEKPVPSTKVEEYVNSEFFYYYQFYTNVKHAGPPLPGGWTQWPPWIPQLLSWFDNAIDQVRAYNERKAYGR